MNEFLAQKRSQIDKIDDEILLLLEKRFAIAKDISIAKKSKNLYRPAREKEILKRLFKKSKKKAIRAIFYEIFSSCRNLLKQEKIAFLKSDKIKKKHLKRFGSVSKFYKKNSIDFFINDIKNQKVSFGILKSSKKAKKSIENNDNIEIFYRYCYRKKKYILICKKDIFMTK